MEKGRLFYDDECSVCRTWISRWKPTLGRRGFTIEPLQSDLAARQFGLDRAELLKNVRLVSNDGTRLEGAGVYRYLMKRIWWTYPLYIFSILPGARALFDSCYRFIADHRRRI